MRDYGSKITPPRFNRPAARIQQPDYAHRELHKSACELHMSVYLLGISNGAGSIVSNQPCRGGREALQHGLLASKSGFAILETVARVPWAAL